MDVFHPQEPINEEILAFGRNNRESVRGRYLEKVIRVLTSLSEEEIAEKFRRGVKEHGGFTMQKLESFDFEGNFKDEVIDGVGYVEGEMFREFRTMPDCSPLSLGEG